MQMLNLTPHAVTVVGDNGKALVTVPPSGQVARVGMTRERAGEVAGLPVWHSRAGEVTGLPAAAEGVAYVVSALVRLAVPHRRDLFSPGELVRDTSGQPIGCRGLEGQP